jgi:dihydrofolate synthase/folylpolyglutamate synthase
MNSGFKWLNTLAPWDGNRFSPLEVPQKILSYLDNPQNKYATVHIAGTNGKGTVASLINHLVVSSKKYTNIGLMTSPHLYDVRERCLINSKLVEVDDLDQALIVIKEASIKLDVVPTYFVGITCAIFYLFAQKEIELGIIEVGLGGLFDATNLMDKSFISVITSIGLDHQEMLGETIEEITTNKAGILKDGQNVVIGNLPNAALEIVNKTLVKLATKNYFYNKDFSFETGNFIIKKNGAENSYPVFKDYLPTYLKENLAIALCALEILGIDNENYKERLKTYFWPRRFNIWARDKQILILDGAHNFQGINSLLISSEELLKIKKIKHISFYFNFLKRKKWQLAARALIDFLQKDKEYSFKLYILNMNENFVLFEEVKSYILENTKISSIDISEVSLDQLGDTENFLDNDLKVIFGSLSYPEELENNLIQKGYIRESIWV